MNAEVAMRLRRCACRLRSNGHADLGAIGRSTLDYLKIAGYFEGLFIAPYETFLHSPFSLVPAHPAEPLNYLAGLLELSRC
jgi:hypothetical protein